LFLVAPIGCSSDDNAVNDDVTQDFADSDGDGVANAVEIDSGTDPEQII